MKALSVRQPWAWAITHGHKSIENRAWNTSHRGLLAIHASALWDGDDALGTVVDLANIHISDVRIPGRHLGAIVAVAELMGICTSSAEQRGCDCGPWAIGGQHHWRLANPRPVPEPVPCKGRLGLWCLPDQVEAAVLDQIAAVTS